MSPEPPPAPRPPRDPDSIAADRALVARLVAMDEDAWTRVIGEMVLPSVFKSRKWSEILARLAVPADAVASEVFHSLAADGCRNLRDFRFEQAFSSFVYSWTMAAMSAIQRNFSGGISFDPSEPGSNPALIPQTTLSPDRIAAARDAFEEANRHLAALWDANPVRSIVLVLRNVNGLRAKEVAELLGLTPANVDQIHKRALAQFQSIAKGPSSGDE